MKTLYSLLFLSQPMRVSLRPATTSGIYTINQHIRSLYRQHSRPSGYVSCGSNGGLVPLSSNSAAPCVEAAANFNQQTCSPIRNRACYTTENDKAPEPSIHSLFERRTGTWQYVVADPLTKKAVIIDAVLDYESATQAISTETADALLETISENRYCVDKILETHIHADHLTAANYLQQQLHQRQVFKPPVCIGKRINQVQKRFAIKYAIPRNEYEGVFDHLFDDEEEFQIGQLTGKVIHLPGHTPDHIGYHIGANVFCGDSIFHADIGTARCDFPGGSARNMYNSAQKLFKFPDDTKIWTGHDYPSCPARCDAVRWMTVKEHKEKNIHLSGNIKEDEFIALRSHRDKGLAVPRLLHPSLQVNIRAGRLPQLTDGGERLLHLPIQTNFEHIHRS